MRVWPAHSSTAFALTLAMNLLRTSAWAILSLTLMTALLGCGSDDSTASNPAPAATPASSSSVHPGIWAASDSRYFADVTSSGATFQFGCAKGQTSQELTLNAQNQFGVTGTYEVTSGPIVVGQTRQFSTTYSGTVSGDTMTLDVSYTDGNGQPQTQNYTLTLGAPSSNDTICAADVD
jgi:hypothetical protein